METHYFGTLAVTRAFAPQLAAAGTSAVLNVLSVMSWYTSPEMSAYSRTCALWVSQVAAKRLGPVAGGDSPCAFCTHTGH
jgi:short-subunit dehydrogenase